MKKFQWLLVMCWALLAMACSAQKEPATQAVAEAEASLAAIRDDAAKYAPEELQTVEAQVATLKDGLAKKDYKSVVNNAPTVKSEIEKLQASLTARKAEAEAAAAQATESWNALSADVPKMVEAIQSRVDTLSKSRKLPRNLDQSTFDSAKSNFESMKTTWTEANNAFVAGNVVDAAAKAQSAKDKGTEVMKQLGMASG
jgi:hypothetical protein